MICVSSTVMPLTCQPVRFKDAFRYTAGKISFFSTHSKSIIKERHTLWSTYTWQKQCQRGRPDLFMMRSFINAIVILLSPLDVAILSFYEMSFFFTTTRPKLPYGRQGLVGLFHVSGWIHFSIFATFFLHFCNMFQ